MNKIFEQNELNYYKTMEPHKGYISEVDDRNEVDLPPFTKFSFMERYSSGVFRIRVHPEKWGPYPTMLVKEDGFTYTNANSEFPDLPYGATFDHPTLGPSIKEFDGWRSDMRFQEVASPDGRSIYTLNLPYHSPFIILWGKLPSSDRFYVEVVVKSLLHNPADDPTTSKMKNFLSYDVQDHHPLYENPVKFDTFDSLDFLLDDINSMIDNDMGWDMSALQNASVKLSP